MLEHVREPRIGSRLRESVSAVTGTVNSPGRFTAWWSDRRQADASVVRRIPFAELGGWGFDAKTGDLGHETGRFFTVEGLHVALGDGREWEQPIINQPEVGVLGILAKEFDGVLHFLMQAKMEPGNPGLLQLSPTVQATRSNFTRAHGGARVRYLEHFTGPARGTVLVDVLQSEHGAWFYRKRNRNMVVESDRDVPLQDDFCWLTLGQIGELLRRDNLVNMDARTVLSCLSTEGEPAREPLTGLVSWITEFRANHAVRTTRLPLRELTHWHRTRDEIRRADGRYFSVVALSVESRSREVSRWTQPMFAPRGRGVVAFLVRCTRGVWQVLVSARTEGGFMDTPELGPTVQCVPANYPHGPYPLFLDQVLTADPARIRYDAVHAEEGGRFDHAESRYLAVDVTGDAPDPPPPGFRWVTLGQLDGLLRHSNYVNVQARSLTACLKFARVLD
ncbi:NDP-hexose 2,3-dehydratase family protein [Amycolatopsis sp. NPDC049688]|uniref:NDP-hexose 2,3-dehydratase family protein n=1 Tax=Amycolatopsis sp. NPDC049688 TaxID=3154733 RepID=UPI003428C708